MFFSAPITYSSVELSTSKSSSLVYLFHFQTPLFLSCSFHLLGVPTPMVFLCTLSLLRLSASNSNPCFTFKKNEASLFYCSIQQTLQFPKATKSFLKLCFISFFSTVPPRVSFKSALRTTLVMLSELPFSLINLQWHTYLQPHTHLWTGAVPESLTLTY